MSAYISLLWGSFDILISWNMKHWSQKEKEENRTPKATLKSSLSNGITLLTVGLRTSRQLIQSMQLLYWQLAAKILLGPLSLIRLIFSTTITRISVVIPSTPPSSGFPCSYKFSGYNYQTQICTTAIGTSLNIDYRLSTYYVSNLNQHNLTSNKNIFTKS